uniref:G_PROTEIN_RECEP_F1_2 domain-containing protein n=1 Tax=Bursaphelenchus xylophilus TaxID=6326 RepID=A0A1I7RP01_BURXY
MCVPKTIKCFGSSESPRFQMTSVNDTVELPQPTCGYTEECGFGRFLFVSIASSLAVLGAAANLLLAYIFTFKTKKNTPPTLYPTALALMDAALCILYFLCFGVDVFMLYLRIESLFIIYHLYIVPAFVMVKIVQLIIPYLLIFVTMERYAWISKHCFSEWLFSRVGRISNLVLCLVLGGLIRLPPAFALTVESYPECLDFFRTLAVDYRRWAKETEWYNFYDLHLIGILQIFIPFIVLVVLNCIILRRLLTTDQENIKKVPPIYIDGISSGSSRASFKVLRMTIKRPTMSPAVRHAVYTTVIIVTSYLICSGLHLLLTFMEKTDAAILKSDDDPTKASIFYTIFGDMISFLYMFTSAIRIFIYCKCNPTVRENVLNTLDICPRGLARAPTLDLISITPVSPVDI